jgi:uncharacterized membrane protein YraQ (UPF0718 family)
MSLTAIIVDSVVLICLIISFFKDRRKTKQALKIALNSFVRLIPVFVVILVAIGLLLGFLPAEMISKILGDQAGFGGVAIAALIGSVMFIPALIAFPLAGSLLQNGVSLTATAAFITTLTMIGFVTLPVEINIMGKKLSLLRNGFSLVIALTVAIIIGAIL